MVNEIVQDVLFKSDIIIENENIWSHNIRNQVSGLLSGKENSDIS